MLGATYDPATNTWLEDPIPDAQFKASLEAIAPNITTIAEQNKTQGESWTDAIIRLLPAVAATWQQKQLIEVQVERAKQGLPPLDANQIAAGVNVGLSSDTQKLAMWAIGGLVLALVLPPLISGRRR